MNSDAKKILKIGGIVLFFIFIITYAFFTSKDLIFGVKIKNININGLKIVDGATITGNTIKITGNAKNATNLTFNGRVISIDELGNFSEDYILNLGYNVIEIVAHDKFGDSDEKIYKLIY